MTELVHLSPSWDIMLGATTKEASELLDSIALAAGTAPSPRHDPALVSAVRSANSKRLKVTTVDGPYRILKGGYSGETVETPDMIEWVVPEGSSVRMFGGAPRSDREIVDQTETLARIFLKSIGTGYEAPADHVFHLAQDPRSAKAWAFACEVMETLTATDPNDAVANLDDEDERPIAPSPENPLMAALREIREQHLTMPFLDSHNADAVHERLLRCREIADNAIKQAKNEDEA